MENLEIHSNDFDFQFVSDSNFGVESNVLIEIADIIVSRLSLVKKIVPIIMYYLIRV